ncbi:asparagine synthetase B family protein [Epibacterium ulvae]|uniref:asparagine synthetase B family protein n=1 Tax=Epibacterium ulvae TaxID=1156985 RepID=UPI002493A7C2|nr:asparagine synthase-related protein [Epibacterium ulvae]
MLGYIAQAFVGADQGSTAAQVERLQRLGQQGWRVAHLNSRICYGTSGPERHADQAVFSPVAVSKAADGTCFIGLAWLNNRAELHAGFDLKYAAERSDLDLIAHLWERDGPACLEQLNGGFSFALFEPESQHIRLYRDHFGMIPLYYCVQDGVLTCGSDIRSVLHLSGLPVAPDQTRIADFLVGEEIDPARTGFLGLKRLPGAHHLGIDLARPDPVANLTPSLYWRLPAPDEISGPTAPQAFRRHLEAACASSTPVADTTGAMLSGGLDSSALTTITAQQFAVQDKPPLLTLSLTYAGKAYDESAYIKEVDHLGQTRPAHIPISEAPDVTQLQDLIEEQMDLFLAYGLQKSRQIYHIAQNHGLTHLIDGHGGDEVVSHGYGRLIELAAARKWGALFLEARGARKIHGANLGVLYLMLIARYGGLRKGGLFRRVLVRLIRLLDRLTEASPDAFEAEQLLAADLKAALDLEKTPRYGKTPDLDDSPAGLKNREQQEHRKILKDPLGEHAFEVLFRSASTANILPLYPFYDRRFVQFCLTLPSDVKLRRGASRWILREALKGVLPEKIRTRSTKANFGEEFAASLLAYRNKGGAIDSAALAGFVDADAVRALERLMQQNSKASPAVFQSFWRVLVLQSWLAALGRWQKLQTAGRLV